MTTTYTLQLVPSTHRVVPVEPDGPMTDAAFFTKDEGFEYQYQAVLEAAPPLDTPPVLRWEGAKLVVGNVSIAVVRERRSSYVYMILDGDGGKTCSLQEARRAAEKALGFPDGLTIEEV